MWSVLVAVLLQAPATAEPTAADVRGAPPPGQESGRIDDPDGRAGMLLVGRGILLVPRVAFEIVSSPVRAGTWAYDRYELRERWYRWFFNDARTIGLYPLIAYDAEYGASVGGRFVARDVLEKGELASVRGEVGGTYSALVRGSLRSGRVLGGVEVELAAEWERRPRDRFFGFGNDDAMAVETRYRQELRRALVAIEVPLAGPLWIRPSAAIADVEYGPGESGTPVDEVYPTDQLVGWNGLRYAYGELELLLDSRRAFSRWELPTLPSTGALVSVYGGRVAVEDGTDFWRVGGDAQYLWRIADGPRVIATRAHVEAVDSSIADTPFDELPKLGGRYLLRGYPTDRFRDRVAGLATVEYRWDLSKYLHAHLFVDAGRVARSVDELPEGELRVGYGLGLDVYTERSYVMRGSLETSIDGGLFFNIVFDPAFDLEPRVTRR